MRRTQVKIIQTLCSLAAVVCALAVPTIGHAAGLASTPRDETTYHDDCSVITAVANNTEFEQEVISLVNQERVSRGLTPLKWVAELDQAAWAHAEDMGVDGYLAHNSQSPDCVWSDRISNYYSGWDTLGENVAGGYATPADAMDAWMNSSGHRANILNESFTEIGVGYYPGGVYGTSWVQDFGSRSDVYPLVINNEDATTESPTVNLYIYGGWSEMRLRTDDGAWLEWMAFENTPTWVLPDSVGDHTVSAEMRTGVTTASAEDSIYLDVVPTGDYSNFLYLPLSVK